MSKDALRCDSLQISLHNLQISLSRCRMLRFMHVDIIDLTKVLDKNACLRDVAFGLKLLLLLIPDAQ